MKKITFLGLLAAGSIAFAPASFAETTLQLPTYKKVNVDVGDGVHAPALEVKSPSGEKTYIKIGEQGLTRTILYNNEMIRDYGRKLNNKIRRAAETKAEKQAERKAQRKAQRKKK